MCRIQLLFAFAAFPRLDRLWKRLRPEFGLWLRPLGSDDLNPELGDRLRPLLVRLPRGVCFGSGLVTDVLRRPPDDEGLDARRLVPGVAGESDLNERRKRLTFHAH